MCMCECVINKLTKYSNTLVVSIDGVYVLFNVMFLDEFCCSCFSSVCIGKWCCKCWKGTVNYFYFAKYTLQSKQQAHFIMLDGNYHYVQSIRQHRKPYIVSITACC